MRKLEYTPSSAPILSFLNEIKRDFIHFNEKYQRQYVWKPSMQQQLIRTIFDGLPIGSLITWINNEKKEIIDGLQRLTTIQKFVNDEFKIEKNTLEQIAEYYSEEVALDNSKESKKITKMLRTQKFSGLLFSELPHFMKDDFISYPLSVTEIRYGTNELIRDFFQRVQIQESLKAGEIIHSIPSNDVSDFLEKIHFGKSMEILGFKNKRRDAEKIAMLFHAIMDGSLSLGDTDKKIINYAQRNPMLNSTFSNRLRVFSSYIQKNKKNFANRKSLNKSEIKILMISICLSGVIFHTFSPVEIIESSCKFVNDIKFFNGNNLIAANARNSLIKQNKDALAIALLLKGTHSREKILEKIDSFNKIILNPGKNELSQIREKYEAEMDGLKSKIV